MRLALPNQSASFSAAGLVAGTPMAPTENVYQMFQRFGGAGFFVKRNSWSHPRSVARVVSVGGIQSGLLAGTPPYFDNPEVLADVAFQGQILRQKLSSPETFAYSIEDRPDWWPSD